MKTRSLAPWLTSPPVPPLCLGLIKRAITDIGICEMPPGSNRSGRIDEYNHRAGVPLGSYWCASAVGAWLAEAQENLGVPIELPRGYASCDNWMAWGKATKRWQTTPMPGTIVLYGIPGDAQHIGVIIRATPLVFSVEGNTSPGGRIRNGLAIWPKIVDPGWVLGYVNPIPLV